MKQIAAVAALFFACSSLCADSLLTGVHTVYIAGNNLAKFVQSWRDANR